MADDPRPVYPVSFFKGNGLFQGKDFAPHPIPEDVVEAAGPKEEFAQEPADSGESNTENPSPTPAPAPPPTPAPPTPAPSKPSPKKASAAPAD